MKNKKGVAIGQALLLVLGIMAFGFILGGEVEVVSAAETCTYPDSEGAPVTGTCIKNDGSCVDGLIVDNCASDEICCGAERTGTTKSLVDTCGNTPDTFGFTCATDADACAKTGTIIAGRCSATGRDVCCSELKVADTDTEVKDKENKDVVGKVTGVVATVASVTALQDKVKGINKKLADTWKSLSGKKKPPIGNVPSKPVPAEIIDVSKMTPEQLVTEQARLAKAAEDGTESLSQLEKIKNQPDTNAGIFLTKLKSYFTGNAWAGKQATLGSGVGASITAAAGAYVTLMIFKVAGAGERNLKTIGGVAKGVALGSTAIFLAWGAFGKSLSLGNIPGPGWVLAGAVAVTAIISAALHKTFSQETFNYKLSLWQPIPKGENCQLCNELEYGCSEYQCRTFGAACDIVNPGTEKEICDWINKNDMNPPIMEMLNVLPVGYRYNPEEVVPLSDRGVVLEHESTEDNCLPAFEGIEFGITTDEPAQCKIDLSRIYNYENMTSFMQEGPLFVYNHTFSIPNIALPSAYAVNEAGFTLDEGNNYEFYMKCKDVNDNTSPFNLVVKFCVDDGPDTTAPTIETNYLNGAYIRSDQVEINDLEVYTNEPAVCRWDFNDKEYNDMTNLMTDCSTTAGDYTFPNSYSYGCKTTLTGIKNGVLNNYYIRCEDKPGITSDSPETKIQNRESYLLSLQGTEGLVIDEILINEKNTIYTAEDGSVEGLVVSDATETIQIRVDALTSQGAGATGDARCSYSQGGYNYEFYNNQNYDYTPINNHNWYLESGDYDYEINCCDLANNCDSADISFNVDSDMNAPQIARSYYEEELMKLITDEEAECTYSLSTCNYVVEDGIKIDTLDSINHFISWDERESFFIKCKDTYGNYPDPNECSIIVRAQYEYEELII